MVGSEGADWRDACPLACGRSGRGMVVDGTVKACVAEAAKLSRKCAMEGSLVLGRVVNVGFCTVLWPTVVELSDLSR